MNLPTYAIVNPTGEPPLWVVKCAHTVTDGDLAPGIDITLRLEGADAVTKDLRISLRVPGQDYAPRIIKGGGMCYLASVQWGEAEIVDGVLLTFRRPDFLSELLIGLAGHLEALGEKFLAPRFGKGEQKEEGAR